MNPLEPPDSYHFSAAEGWLALGSGSDALAELEKLSPASRDHPDVLSLRWYLFARAKNWKTCSEIGKRLVDAAPELVSSWQNYANSLFYDRRYHEAYEALFPAIQKFPSEWSIPYNLACYLCQLSQLEEALFWFKMALALGKPEEVKKQALKDPDLDPLRKAIRML